MMEGFPLFYGTSSSDGGTFVYRKTGRIFFSKISLSLNFVRNSTHITLYKYGSYHHLYYQDSNYKHTQCMVTVLYPICNGSHFSARILDIIQFCSHAYIWQRNAVTRRNNRGGRARSVCGGTRWSSGGEVKGKLANGVGSQYSHATSERGISSITQADAHTSAASSRLNWHPHRFKWTRPFQGKTKSGFCACAITFHTSYTKHSKDKYWKCSSFKDSGRTAL